jgi:PAS domain S-box-containing protein
MIRPAFLLLWSPPFLTDGFSPWACLSAVGFGMLGVAVAAVCRIRRIHIRTTQALKDAEAAFGATEQRWKLLFEQSPLSIQIFAPDGQTRRFNNAWRELFRLSDEQGFAFNVLKDPDLNASGAVNLIRRAFDGEAVTVPPVLFPVNTDPPQHRWIGGVLYPVKDRDGRVLEVVTIHHDITEMKRAEEAMQAINQTLEQRVTERTAELESARSDLARALETERDLSLLKSRFVSMVSHEFRTPLGVIMSAVELLRHYDDRLPAGEKTSLLGDIHGATSSMAGMMEQVLLLGRVEAGKLGFRSQPLDFAALARKLAAEVAASSQSKCPLTLLGMENLDGARGDEALIRHIFSNLLGNAVKYSPDGSEVVLRVFRQDSHLVCSVEDRGIGIPEKDRPHLFEAFHRCENVGDIQGTGLGLVIVKRCVDLHGGSIDFLSTPGLGTTFTVRLPLFAAG